MSFYIAQRSKKDNTFQIRDKNGKPHEFIDEAEAIDAYELTVRFNGINNVLLLETIDVNVVVIATPQSKEKVD